MYWLVLQEWRYKSPIKSKNYQYNLLNINNGCLFTTETKFN